MVRRLGRAGPAAQRERDFMTGDDTPPRVRTVGCITTPDGATSIYIDHVYSMETCEHGQPDEGLVGLAIRPDDGPEAHALLGPDDALLIAERLTRAAALIMETGEDCPTPSANTCGTPAATTARTRTRERRLGKRLHPGVAQDPRPGPQARLLPLPAPHRGRLQGAGRLRPPPPRPGRDRGQPGLPRRSMHALQLAHRRPEPREERQAARQPGAETSHSMVTYSARMVTMSRRTGSGQSRRGCFSLSGA